MPLANDLRPKKLEDFFGQEHLIGKDKVLSRIVNSKDNYLPNIIFFGTPGIGKTTLAEILASYTNKSFYRINASTASLSDLKDIIEESKNISNVGAGGIVLYVDELQQFNRSQQQKLLEFIEKGSITLIASTTENPYHYIYKAILSRSLLLELKPLEIKDIVKGLNRGIKYLIEKEKTNFILDNDSLEYLAILSDGDMRKALNLLELVFYTGIPDKENTIKINIDSIKKLNFSKISNFDKDGDSHYDLLSAFQKSIRGSDPNASLHYLARLIKSGDLISICRRLLVIASEDIGLAYPSAISIVKSCTDTAMQVGLPEARFTLAQATVLLATSPKSNSLHIAIDEALYDLETNINTDIPMHLKDSHYSGAKNIGRGVDYKYPHNYPNNYIKQQYLPDNLKDRQYYNPQNNKFEQNIDKYLKFLEKSE